MPLLLTRKPQIEVFHLRPVPGCEYMPQEVLFTARWMEAKWCQYSAFHLTGSAHFVLQLHSKRPGQSSAVSIYAIKSRRSLLNPLGSQVPDRTPTSSSPNSLSNRNLREFGACQLIDIIDVVNSISAQSS